jgi:hypothetical protein
VVGPRRRDLNADQTSEFHQSGYDSSDKKAQPDFPVIFTKRATSIVGHNATIYPHPKVTRGTTFGGRVSSMMRVPSVTCFLRASLTWI